MTLSVVIVDDSELFLDAARDLLERGGVAVLGVASTAAEALDQVRQLQPDAVLVDVHLGAESGLDLVRRLSEDGRCGRSTAILMSTYTQAELAGLIDDVPAAGFVTKGALSVEAVDEIHRRTTG